jgi:threonylcarbamoyladenosine tRNA methylthiotransferase MtaB
MKQKKYKVVTLGCRTNQYESQAYIDQLNSLGYTEASDEEKADICIVNTCTVTASADKRSLYQIRKLRREYDPKRLVVTGCLAERGADQILKIEGVTDLVPNKNKETLLKRVFPEEEWPEFKIEQFEAHTRAFVKIQDGCNSYCSYCVIPFVRGRSRSKSVDEILREIEGLVENGYKEVVLTGINIGDFDGGTPENPTRLSTLVRLVDKIPGIERIRISSIDPDEIDDDLLEAVIRGKKTCHSMHIVLQSGSNLTLKRMRRKYTKQEFLDAVKRLSQESSDFTFTTDIIVGFPGESEEDFEETLELVREVRFAKVHMFPYSDRPKTRASRMPHKLDAETIDLRRQKLLKLADEVAFDLRQESVGRTFDVLLENQNMGHTNHFLPVIVSGATLRPNEIIRVVCTDNQADALIGYQVEAHALKTH